MKKLISLLLAALMLLCCPRVYGAEESEYSFEGKDWDTVISEFLDKYNIDPDTLAFGYYNTVTGEEHYWGADKYMTAASLYKLPLNMYFTEKVSSGEIGWDTLYGGYTYEVLLQCSIEYSNNELSEMLADQIGTYSEYRAAIAPVLGVDPESVDSEYFNGNCFTPRQMIHALKELWENQESYPRILEHMKKASPDSYFSLSEDRFEIAHKYGFFEHEGHYIANDCGLVYTDDPILLVMFTDNCAGGVMTLARYCTLMCDYAQYTRQLRLKAEAEAAARAEEATEPKPETPAVTEYPEPAPTPEPTPIPEPEPEETEQEQQDGGFLGVFLLLAGLAGAYALMLGSKKKK